MVWCRKFIPVITLLSLQAFASNDFKPQEMRLEPEALKKWESVAPFEFLKIPKSKPTTLKCKPKKLFQTLKTNVKWLLILDCGYADAVRGEADNFPIVGVMDNGNQITTVNFVGGEFSNNTNNAFVSRVFKSESNRLGIDLYLSGDESLGVTWTLEWNGKEFEKKSEKSDEPIK